SALSPFPSALRCEAVNPPPSGDEQIPLLGKRRGRQESVLLGGEKGLAPSVRAVSVEMGSDGRQQSTVQRDRRARQRRIKSVIPHGTARWADRQGAPLSGQVDRVIEPDDRRHDRLEGRR